MILLQAVLVFSRLLHDPAIVSQREPFKESAALVAFWRTQDRVWDDAMFFVAEFVRIPIRYQV